MNISVYFYGLPYKSVKIVLYNHGILKQNPQLSRYYKFTVQESQISFIYNLNSFGDQNSSYDCMVVCFCCLVSGGGRLITGEGSLVTTGPLGSPFRPCPLGEPRAPTGPSTPFSVLGQLLRDRQEDVVDVKGGLGARLHE